MTKEHLSEQVAQWLIQLKDYVDSHSPELILHETKIKRLPGKTGSAVIQWNIQLENPFFLDVKCRVPFVLIDEKNQSVPVKGTWTWHPDIKTKHRYERMDEGYLFYARGARTDTLSGIIRMPESDAKQIYGMRAQIATAEFDLFRFLPRWSPCRNVVSDRVLRKGKLNGIRARTNILNEEYSSLELTPVFQAFNEKKDLIKEATFEPWMLPPRTADGYEKYIPLKKREADQYHHHWIKFVSPRCMFQEMAELIRIEGRKSSYVKNDKGEDVYETGHTVFNHGYRHARVSIQYSLFFNTQTPTKPIALKPIELPPRASADIQSRFSYKQVNRGKFLFIQAEPDQIEWGDFYPILHTRYLS